MNFNATSGARYPAQKGSRKKRVSDTAAINAPAYPPAYPPSYPPPYNPFASAVPGTVPPNMSAYDDRNAVPPPYASSPDYSHMHANAPPMDQGYSIPGQFLNEPLVANVAMQYGQALVGSGRQLVDRELEKYIPVSRLKYYFAVDTRYVLKKLGLLFFPFVHSDWSVKYEQDGPVQPRYEINAPDLYIPTMAYVTYVLVAGVILGMQDRFTPEILGIQASSALAWTIFEIAVELITLYITNIQTNLKTLDLLAFGGYKYVGIIFALLLSILFHKTGYYAGLIYSSFSLAFFLIRTLKVQVLPDGSSPHHNDPYTHSSGNKRRMYLLLFVAGIQPLLMWWLSFHLISPPTPKS
ncbi:protein YIF1B isoform X2 [Zootermopsis nevadensis]|uniref:Protein YIF1 n=1 Tax=Zootermopsis nevadensis TaxID=136037 RepID=A0A067RD41_ZOONE|nr:protein YIF1B isoform X2 [Zootermopsis nevadensis]KDR20942.1 Protein YIF1B-A [Zootermopsis nevadensis]